MSHLIPNTFSTYQLTDEEYKQGAVYSNLQAQVIQNAIAEAAEVKSSLVLDPNDVMSYVQQEAYNKGKIEILQYLLAESEYCAQQIVNPTGEDTANPLTEL